MISAEVEIVNKLGLHARAAAKLVDCANHFASRVRIGSTGNMVDAKSIMSVMMLAAGKGTLLALEVDGRDEVEAMKALAQLIGDRFGEPE